MRIERVHIDSYGPLSGRDFEFPGDFTLFFGRNERGKTLIVDAMIKFLVVGTRKLKTFEGVERVDERPAGFIVVTRNGLEHKLTGREGISGILDVPLSPEDLRNIFVTRDSDLAVIESGKYYEDFASRLTGLQTDLIDRVVSVLRRDGNLTPKGELSNAAESGHAKDRLDRADRLLEKIELVKKRLEEAGFESLEKRLAEAEARIGALEEEEKILAAAGRRRDLEDALQKLEEYERTTHELKEMAAVGHEILGKWRSVETNLRAKETYLVELERKITRLEESKEHLKEELEGLRFEMRRMEKIEKDIDTSIALELEACKKLDKDLQGSKPIMGFARLCLGVSILIFTAGFTGLTARGGAGMSVLMWAGLAGLVISGSYVFKIRRRRGELAKRVRNLLGMMVGFHEGDEDLEAMAKSIHEFENHYAKLEHDLGARTSEFDEISGELRTHLENRKRTKLDMETLKREIDEMKTGLRMSSMDELNEALEKKNELLSKKNKLAGELSANPNFKEIEDDKISDLMEKTKADLESYEDGARCYDERRHLEVKSELQSLLEERTRLRDALNDGDRILSELESEIENSGIFEGKLSCRSSTQLDDAEARIGRFAKEIRMKKETASLAIGIMQSIRGEELADLGDLFGQGEAVSEYFSTITEGSYREVEYDSASNVLYVADGEGRRLDARCLSGGTLDQLYMAVRLALGEKALGGEPGFFILDDPFLKSDYERLESQMNLLRKAALRGWQIIYFSAKREVMEVLESDIDAGEVRLVELEERI
jgi:DNA repair exonuclease SbcCD ATPase subunit